MPYRILPDKKLIIFGYDINPEPWAIGNITIERNKQTGKLFPKVGPELTLKSYQDALRASLLEDGAKVKTGPYSIRFTFSRQLVKYSVDKHTLTRNWADVTNMQKSTEDALQGAAIANDSATIHIESYLYAGQSEATPAWVVGEILYERPSYSIKDLSFGTRYTNTAREYIEALEAGPSLEILNNEWTP